MKLFAMILAAVFALAAYDCHGLWRLAPGGWPVKLAAAGVFLLWMACQFGGYFVMERLPVPAAAALYAVGNAWFPFALYFALVRLSAGAAAACSLVPKAFLRDSAAGFLAVVGVVALVMVLGGLQHHRKQRVELSIATTKPLEKPLTIVLASDLHLGYPTSRAELARWMDLFNAENPDLVLLGGDVLDMGTRAVEAGGHAEEFRRLRAPVWAVMGNHEHYGGTGRTARFFAEAGIRLLSDSTARFKGVDVIGRDDATNPGRAPLADLAAGCDGFTIVLDHQPRHLEEAERAGIDFQFSGHTHRGQIWPVSWITDAMFEKSWGPHRRGNTRYYVSSGLGIWGAKIRIGTRAEYLVLHLSPADKPSATRAY